jgi:hypothetical protein
VWEDITIPSYATQARYGARAGQPNPRFLDAKLFNEMVLMPYHKAQFEAHTGPSWPFLFEFQQHGMSSEDFCSRLNGFFSNATLLGTDYHKVLETHSVALVYNHWSYMPPLVEQYAQLKGFTALFTVLRLLTPLKMSYEAANKCTESYAKIVEELPQMRRRVVHLVRQAVSVDRRAYVPHQQSL